MTNLSIAPSGVTQHSLTRGMVMLFAFCCGAIVANLYYAQPIVEMIAPAVGLSSQSASLIVSLTQIGYALGLLLLVPLADLIENRKLMMVTTLVAAGGLLAAGLASEPNLFLVLSLLIGFSSVSVQMLIPLAAHLAPEATRGRVVGNIMSGLLLGILLARPLSSLVADHFGWRAIFIGAALVMLLINLVIALTIPQHKPAHRASYSQLMRSLLSLVRHQPVLRRRAFYQGLLFASFSLFWTAVPIELVRHQGLSQTQVAIFALVGAIGALAAPVAGRLADAGHTWRASLVAMTIAVGAMLMGWTVPGASLVGLALTGILLDFAVQMNMVLGQRAVYALEPASRARLNALYMTSIFIGGAIGSALASPLYEMAGWPAISLAGGLLPLIALAFFAYAEPKRRATNLNATARE
ncbi:MFS transporter [Pseudomonas segetis]|uniref:Predicted arabinose efflux permease, MFS family n=1 Tax=Pseudomonas segetis TaxID=298908 RepID=A0A239IP40_9PSED|nr:MFS transporter [Pseudomonas segetis]SNS95321.1 Predicted arabinose efflux permease, MFS family [Pseudomonas segetis]